MERMRFRMIRRSWVIVALLSMSACASETVFVLLDNPDGTTGAIEVKNEAGTQVVDQARQATRVTGARDAPQAPKTLTDAEISATWGEALRASARDPKTFILYFKSGTNELVPESAAQLPDILRSISEFPSVEVSVVGHTDRVGARDVNARLALRRANVIRDRLIAQGLRRDLIQVDSHGEDNPLVKTRDEISEPRNRRVEVTVR